MAQRTVLQLVNQIQQELGLPQSATVIGNTDVTTVQLLSFLQLSNEELRDYSDEGWKVLQFEFNINVAVPTTITGNLTLNTAAISSASSITNFNNNYYSVVAASGALPQGCRTLSATGTTITLNMLPTAAETNDTFTMSQDTYTMPSDFRKYTNRSWWDRTNHWELLGPDSAQLDQWHRSGIVATGPRRHFRNIGPYGNTYRLWPAPDASVTSPIQLVFEYISLNTVMVKGSNTTFASSFANDTDIPLLDDRALMLGMKWRMWEQKGLNWMSKRDEYDRWVNRLLARDGGAQTLNMVKRINPIFISPSNVQDGFFPSPTWSISGGA